MIQYETEKLIKEINFSNLKNKKILITGASGLIGLYLVSCLKHLQKKNNLSIYTWIKSDLPQETEFLFLNTTIIHGDICDEKNFSDLPKFDVIFHCAGYGQPSKFLQDKIKTILLNTTSTINLFNHLKEKGKFIFISTSELYNGLELENIDEKQIGSTNTNHPRACYIEGKRCGESICYSFSDLGFDVKIIRLSLAYGPGTKRGDERVLNSLIEKGLNNEKIELLDKGDAIRTYCYITDVIHMIWNISLYGNKIVYNVGGISKIKIFDLANLIGKKLNKKVVIPENYNSMIGNPKIVNISIKTYLDEFGSHEFVSLDDGLTNTINWQKKIYEKNNS